MEETDKLQLDAPKKDDFNSILQSIGGFGNQQKILFLTQCTLSLFYAFVLFGHLFMALTPPDHWCAVDASTRELLQTKMLRELHHEKDTNASTVGSVTPTKSHDSEVQLLNDHLDINHISQTSRRHVPPSSRQIPMVSEGSFRQSEVLTSAPHEESQQHLKSDRLTNTFVLKSLEKSKLDLEDRVLEAELEVRDQTESSSVVVFVPELTDTSNLEKFIRHVTIPRTEAGDDYEHCIMYDVNWAEETRRGAVLAPNSSWPTKRCSDGWHYDYSLYYPTVTSENSWVCENAGRLPFAQAMFFVGSLVGGPLFGWLADARGRRIALIASNFLTGFAGVAAALSPNLAMFCVTLFVLGFNAYPQINILYILVMEFVSPEHRGFVGTVPFMGFLTLGFTLLPWLAYFSANWRVLGVLMYAPLLTTPLLWWFIPESVRWLLGKGQHKRALQTLEGVARRNGVELTEKLSESLKAFVSSHQVSCSVPVWHLLRTPRLRKHFVALCILLICIRLLYDAHVRITQFIRLNLFVTFSVASALEVFAGLTAYLLADRLGRRTTTVVMLLLAAAGEAASAVVDQDNQYLQLSLHLAGKLSITTAINICFMFPVEVLPTVARSQATSVIHTLGFAVAFASPYIAYLAEECRPCALLVLSAVALLGAMTCLLVLPETRGKDLPDTLQEGEDFCRDQQLCCRGQQGKEEDAGAERV